MNSKTTQKPVVCSDPGTLPCSGQTAATICAWAQHLEVGSPVALRQSLGHVYFEYKLGEVEAFTDQGRRVMVKGFGTFWRTPNAAGKNCSQPKGQLSMISPTEAVVLAAKDGVRHRISTFVPILTGVVGAIFLIN